MSIQMQRFKILLNKLFAKAKEINILSPYCQFDGDLYPAGFSDGYKITTNVKTGDFTLRSPSLQTQHSGLEFNSSGENVHVALGVYYELSGIGYQQSHIELIYSDGIKPILDGLNTNNMEHFIFYVVYEINQEGGRLVKTLKSDSVDIVNDMKNHSWNEVVSALQMLKGYPLSILNVQQTHSQSSCTTGCHCKFSTKATSRSPLAGLDLLSKQDVA